MAKEVKRLIQGLGFMVSEVRRLLHGLDFVLTWAEIGFRLWLRR